MSEVLQPALGAFGAYGGRYVSELLTRALAELEQASVRSTQKLSEARAKLDEVGRAAAEGQAVYLHNTFDDACAVPSPGAAGREYRARAAPTTRRTNAARDVRSDARATAQHPAPSTQAARDIVARNSRRAMGSSSHVQRGSVQACRPQRCLPVLEPA